MKKIAFIILMAVGLFVFWQKWSRPFKFCNTDGWQVAICFKGVLDRVKQENIKEIIFCSSSDTNDVDTWDIVFRVPPERLNGAIELLNRAVHQSDIMYSMNPWGYPALRIFKSGNLWIIPKVKLDIVKIPVIVGKNCSQKGIEIITDKGKYLFPASWSSNAIRGADWASRELRKYFIDCGWNEPNCSALDNGYDF